MDIAKFRLGKIVSKHLILEILSFAEHSDKAALLLHKSCRRLRLLIKENYRVFIRVLIDLIPSKCFVDPPKEKAYLKMLLGDKNFMAALLYRGSHDGWGS